MSSISDARFLAEGAITVKGRMPWSTNVTLLVELSLEGETGHAIYKPRRGERRLWDFPPGLFKREIAAYVLSEALGWGLVPLTVARDDGPHGEGSLQRFVAADFEQHYFTLRERPEHHDRLRRICLFDLVANNADRKSGHCLLGEDGAIWAIDNGLCFHVDDKLRTVIWEFAGEPIPAPLARDLERLLGTCGLDALAGLIDDDEREAMLLRARALLDEGTFPTDGRDYRYPWPDV
ncbi:MAG: SCO1664 family protein [Candidatus Rokubacteria bacterium]|nr:SCO1664 family protein [Candidatus Rokubacteria bacterium]MBI3826365.1 SCO1664 family protein [Candidatus Rokubacteria bacterium]